MNTKTWRVIAPLALCAATSTGAANAAASYFISQPSDVTSLPSFATLFDAASVGDTWSQWEWSRDGGATWKPDDWRDGTTYLILTEEKLWLRRRVVGPNGAELSRVATVDLMPTNRRLELLAGGIGGAGWPVFNRDDGTRSRLTRPGWMSIALPGAYDYYVRFGQGGVFFHMWAEPWKSTGVAYYMSGTHYARGIQGGKGASAHFGDIRGSLSTANGDVYLVDSNTVRKIAVGGMTTVFAGSGAPGSADGKGRAASFNQPTGIARDRAGNFYVADTGNHTIRKITPDGVVTTWAGKAGVPGSGGTTLADALFNGPQGLAFGPNRALYVTDTGSHTIRRITKDGQVGKLAGETGVPGSSDGRSGDAHFNTPRGITVDADNVVYVADSLNHTVRKIVGATVTTFAGSAGSRGYHDDRGGLARFNEPIGLVVSYANTLLVADSENHVFRRIDNTSGLVTTWFGRASRRGFADATGTLARFADPAGLAIDATGNIYVADQGNARVRKVTSAGEVSSFGLGSGGSSRIPRAVALDTSGNMYVADAGSCVIRRITPNNVATILAGEPGDCRYRNGNGTAARFVSPSGITLDTQGNFFVTDGTLIRKITPTLDVSRHAGANLSDFSRDGTLYTARFVDPKGPVFDAAGNLYVADRGAIRKISGDEVTTLAGSLDVAIGLIDGVGGEARFTSISALAIDATGNLYAADPGANAVRKITPEGVVTTVVGTHGQGAVVLGVNPLVNRPAGLAVIDSSHLAISDENAIVIYTLQ